MGRYFRTDGVTEELDTQELSSDGIDALKSPVRRRILELLSERPSYPAKVSKNLDIGKQKTYYHFKKLKEASLIEKQREEKHSGGMATFYRPTADAFFIDLGGEGRRAFLPGDRRSVRRFLNPFVSGGEIKGRIVVGSPEPHGPDQVSARDGHLSGEIAAKIGSYGETKGDITILDTELSRENNYQRSLLLLGGVLTNTAAKKFNEHFPVNFSGEAFPYREIETPEEIYDDPDIGIVAKALNPESPEHAIYLVAGVRTQGTRAAVVAFRNLEEVLEDYKGGEYYRVVKGLDLDGDGVIDDYKVIE